MAGVNWDVMPIWPAKRAAAYLGLRRSRMLKIMKGEIELPEGAPTLDGEQDEAKHYYLVTESVKAFKEYLDANPGALPTGGRRLPEGYARYRAYFTDAQAQDVASLFAEDPNVRVEKVVRKKKVKPAEVEAEETPEF